MKYIALARVYAERASVKIVGWCLMSNHVHLAVIPRAVDSLALMFRTFHSTYSHLYQQRRGTTGHLFQARFHSFPAEDEATALEVIRYIELNPVRSGIARRAQHFPYCSARSRVLGTVDPLMRESWSPTSEIKNWDKWLHEMVAAEACDLRAHLIRLETLQGGRRGDGSGTVP